MKNKNQNIINAPMHCLNWHYLRCMMFVLQLPTLSGDVSLYTIVISLPTSIAFDQQHPVLYADRFPIFYQFPFPGNVIFSAVSSITHLLTRYLVGSGDGIQNIVHGMGIMMNTELNVKKCCSCKSKINGLRLCLINSVQ